MMTTAEIKAQRAAEWHACGRCLWEGDKCVKCGRPKGSPKNWRPAISSVSPAVSSTEPAITAVSQPADQLQAEIEELMADEFKAMGKPVPTTAPTSSIPTDVSATVDLSASASTVERSPIERDSTEAPAVAAQPPFAPGKAPMGFPAILSAAPAAATVTTLAAHSPLGGSSAERWMKCSGSVELSRHLHSDSVDGTEEEWTAEGTLAHTLLEHCLKNDVPDALLLMGGPGGWEAVTERSADGVQFAIDYLNSRPGRRLVEQRFHRPELHPLYYGQADVVLYGVQSDWIEIFDFKNGAGVVVEVERNEQLMYYACGVLQGPDFVGSPDETPVRLTICQPNAWHSAGRLRSWDTTAGYLRSWLHDELLPSMRLTQHVDGWFLDMGEHCRFCPAKLACPAMENLTVGATRAAGALAGSPEKVKMPDGWRPPPWMDADKARLMKMLVSAYYKWAMAELSRGRKPEEVGAKLVVGRADRQWKDGAEAELVAALGEQAYERKLVSPAKAEDLPGGDKLVARWAFKPDAGPSVVPLSSQGTPYAKTYSAVLAQKAVA